MQKVLMVAFHYPPFQGGSGIHRTLKFSRYLPDHGWQPIVLSAHPRAYPKVGKELVSQVPRDLIVKRAFAVDSARHLSVCGRYIRATALPDQWISWWFAAVWSGLRLVRKYRPKVLWSTYPIATAHLIGFTLHRLTGIPWVADFRDSMTEENYPRDQWSRETYLWIERRAVKHAARLVFTAPSTRRMYLQRYPKLGVDHCLLIPNGYDEEDFSGIEVSSLTRSSNSRAIRMLHAGLIYTDDRDPRAFFSALSRLKKESVISCDSVLIDLRASGSENYYAGLLKELDIEDIVRILPPLPHRRALEDCAATDALVLFQAASCNHQIPAKAYEYLRIRKPILALTPMEGDTANLLVEVGGATIVDLTQEEQIYQTLPPFLNSLRNNTHSVPNLDRASRYSRKRQTHHLSECLSQVVSKA
jgi:glycosyltransferase involved in cell wall biosynthesis